MANASNDNGSFLTVAEVADLMRVSKMTVYRLIHSEELPAVQVGRNFRVRESAVNEYLGSSEYTATKTG
ncbi:helix-turn-helix domain-containing protein [Corynebacterium sp. 320]|uniref:Helix-turn-helix domain-containing protein n=1 Tax=Corynebacterium zhongnanshanii TaxID=2768834 RepID=A0ABQ6VE66_9CORY|nr:MULTISPECIES: helix-turn-helix domain-containing protein [Corynebacterium]KAB1504425.1 helix-turn-helix domain-containing protein [Corynebacterium sp. 320]KAB1552476.1 helix-turn-helix domain-containing protein [Corynebacterium sp. 321]KAB1554309.1 helix-turn-helix domain-containing protein [Corynebacterium sp. 319]KAB3522719.1 helix-turn-helix domain-containing protein [Corynebacterium zhongnanshanii]KAB3528561.1 helix-turn-helix domain-containing protein [Corynebacterium sp. 250]